MRCFISIDIPENIKKEIKKIQDYLPEFFGKKTEVENLHLTLKFLGEVDEKEIEGVKNKLKEIKFDKFEVRIDSLGVFSEKFIKIVWLHLVNCVDLQKEIDEKLKPLFEKEQRFMSHLTIARVKSLKDKKKFLEALNNIEIPKLRFSVEKFKLKKSILSSKGPRYETLESYGLS